MKKEILKIGTVCTGIGSPEYGLKGLGVEHEVVFGCEIDKYARNTYLANFEVENMYENMTKDDILRHYVDLFVGGIPCQSFSLAGKRKGELDPRGTLFYDFYNYVKVQRPKFFIIENVKGLLSDCGGRTFQNWLDLLGQSVNTEYVMFPHEDSLCYNLHWTVLNAKDFGVPQNRERVFIVGIRSDLANDFRFPVGYPLKLRLKDVLEKEVDEKYYLSDSAIKSIIQNAENLQKSSVNPDIANALQSPGHACGVYKGANYVIPEATKKGFDIATEGDSINISNPNSETRRGRVGNTFANTLETACNQVVVEPFCVAMRGRNPDNPSDRTTGGPTEQRLEPNSNGIDNTITSVQKDNLIVEPQIIQYIIPEMVSVRKFEVDVLKLQACLKQHKNFKTIKSIATGLDVPKTMVEHWFRTDKCFSIPDAKYWFQLKELLAIHTNEFDASITEFEEKPNEFEKANRVYDDNGLAPTITSTSADERIMLSKVAQLSGSHESSGRIYSDQGLSPTITAKQGGGHEPYTQTHNRIRRLTPLECFRLMGFSDEFFYKAKYESLEKSKEILAKFPKHKGKRIFSNEERIERMSDSQLYKQAGNSIVTTVIGAIEVNLLKDYIGK